MADSEALAEDVSALQVAKRVVGFAPQRGPGGVRNLDFNRTLQRGVQVGDLRVKLRPERAGYEGALAVRRPVERALRQHSRLLQRPCAQDTESKKQVKRPGRERE